MEEITAFPKSQKCYLTNHLKFSFDPFPVICKRILIHSLVLWVCFPLCIWSFYSACSKAFYSAKMMLMKEKTLYVYVFCGLDSCVQTIHLRECQAWTMKDQEMWPLFHWDGATGEEARKPGLESQPHCSKAVCLQLDFQSFWLQWTDDWVNSKTLSLFPSWKFHFTWVNMRTNQSLMKIWQV